MGVGYRLGDRVRDTHKHRVREIERKRDRERER